MVTKNYRVYSPEMLKEAYKAFDPEEIKKLQHIATNKAIFEYQQVSDGVFGDWCDPDIIFDSAKYASNEETFKAILKRAKLVFEWKIESGIKYNTRYSRNIYADKDVVMKINHVSLVPKED